MKILMSSYTKDKKVTEYLANLVSNYGCDVTIDYIDVFYPLSADPLLTHNGIAHNRDAAIIVIDSDIGKEIFTSENYNKLRQHFLYKIGYFIACFSPDNVCVVDTKSGFELPDILKEITRISLNHVTAERQLLKWLRHLDIETDNVKSDTRIINFMSLERAFSYVLEKVSKFDNIRVFALSTIKSASILMKHGIKAKKATILLREFTIIDAFYQTSMEDSIDKSVELWEQMRESGNINNMELLRYDFHPTTGLYIFDNRYVIMGNVYFDIKNEEYTFGNKEVLLIDSSSDDGKIFIDKCISHFDTLAEIYRE